MERTDAAQIGAFVTEVGVSVQVCVNSTGRTHGAVSRSFTHAAASSRAQSALSIVVNDVAGIALVSVAGTAGTAVTVVAAW